MVVWSFLWRHALWHILFLHIFAPMSIANIIKCRGTILSVVRHSIMRYRTWSIQGWLTWLGQVWPPILCLRILHMEFFLLLVFSRLIWMLMVLIVAWYFGTSRVKDLDQSTLGTSFGSSSAQSTFRFLLWSSSESFPFCWVQFLFRHVFILLSLVLV